MIKSELEEYYNLLNIVFNKPPKDVGNKALKTIKSYQSDIVYIAEFGHMVAAVIIIKLGKNVYGISNMAVHPKKQKQGYGKDLMFMVFEKYKGTFILRSRNSKEFWKKIGFIKLENIMVYNNKEIGF